VLCNEEVLSLSEAAAVLPRLNGKRPHVSTLWRWARRGLYGIRLETRRVGRRFVTSREALERFSVRLAEIDPPNTPTCAEKPRSETERDKSISRATKTLVGAGIL
jgi:hypothetical protein